MTGKSRWLTLPMAGGQAMTKEQLLSRLAPYGQQHLLAFWDELDQQGRQSLARQIWQIDLGLVERLFSQGDRRCDYGAMAARSQPPPAIRLPPAKNPFAREEAIGRGKQALSSGKVGAILVAGGQGTRLGFPHPKGMFPIGPLSKRSLFQIHVEKLRATAARYGKPIPLYLMTSPATHDETIAFFAEHQRFGLPENELFIFCQGTMPAVDATSGRILLAAREQIALSPDGHGGMLAAIVRSGGLEHMRQRGLELLFYFQVDNPLVEVCSPEFLGYHLLSGSEMTTQVVAKQHPLEQVGNVVQIDGRLHVIEYSDLPDEQAHRRTADGRLAIWAGSIAVHAFQRSFLERMAGMAEALPFHVARKRVPYIDAAGNRVEPGQPNALKFERFIFDLMPYAAKAIVVEIDPAEGFAPLKHGSGDGYGTAAWVQQCMMAQHRRWLWQAGAELPADVPVEISPLFALDAHELAAKIAAGTRITQPTYFCQ
jgi:UDP-N-acetylglucosamine/UDP-N-acetylgalactosamine diphosphorylase